MLPEPVSSSLLGSANSASAAWCSPARRQLVGRTAGACCSGAVNPACSSQAKRDTDEDACCCLLTLSGWGLLLADSSAADAAALGLHAVVATVAVAASWWRQPLRLHRAAVHMGSMLPGTCGRWRGPMQRHAGRGRHVSCNVAFVVSDETGLHPPKRTCAAMDPHMHVLNMVCWV